jgi:hypothetical protein
VYSVSVIDDQPFEDDLQSVTRGLRPERAVDVQTVGHAVDECQPVAASDHQTYTPSRRHSRVYDSWAAVQQARPEPRPILTARENQDLDAVNGHLSGERWGHLVVQHCDPHHIAARDEVMRQPTGTSGRAGQW